MTDERTATTTETTVEETDEAVIEETTTVEEGADGSTTTTVETVETPVEVTVLAWAPSGDEHERDEEPAAEPEPAAE